MKFAIGFDMARSKLEIYLSILEVLALRGPLSLSHLTLKARLNHNVAKPYLNFLVKQNLVEKKGAVGKKKAIYTITKSGWKILKYFWETKQVLKIQLKGV